MSGETQILDNTFRRLAPLQPINQGQYSDCGLSHKMPERGQIMVPPSAIYLPV